MSPALPCNPRIAFDISGLDQVRPDPLAGGGGPWEFQEISGKFLRIVTEDWRDQVRAPGQGAEGRLCHDRQPALCLSPKPEWAEIAIDIYMRAGNPPRRLSEVEIGPTWTLSDLARERGAEGMIFTSRGEPSRWHLVLFDWTNARLIGLQLDFPLG